MNLFEEKLNKYADLLLRRCVSLKKGQNLFIRLPKESNFFAEPITRKARELGVNNIYYNWIDQEEAHSVLQNGTEEEIKKYFDESIYDEQLKSDTVFLRLFSEDPDFMSDISPKRLALMSGVVRESKPQYYKRVNDFSLQWCIASTSSLGWSRKAFPGSNDSYEKLWEAIFESCLINSDDPVFEWNRVLAANDLKIKLLNEMNFKELRYKNSYGTDFRALMPDHYKWLGGNVVTPNGTPVILNMPTLEVFTSPDKFGIDGHIVSTMPLVDSGCLIENLAFDVFNGKIEKVYASLGKEFIEEKLKTTKCYDRIGEIALVDYSSQISQMGILFYDSLFDENSRCHLAIGDGFTESYLGDDKDCINECSDHTDFMIGSEDLNIVGIARDDSALPVFEDGNFVLDKVLKRKRRKL